MPEYHLIRKGGNKNRTGPPIQEAILEAILLATLEETVTAIGTFNNDTSSATNDIKSPLQASEKEMAFERHKKSRVITDAGDVLIATPEATAKLDEGKFVN